MLIKTIQYSLISVFSFDSHRLHHSWNRQFKPFSDGLNCFYFPVRKQRHAPVYNSSFHNIFDFCFSSCSTFTSFKICIESSDSTKNL